MSPEPQEHQPAPVGALRQWILEHDERWLFILAYVGLAVVLSLWISLFWLAAVVAGHGALEWVRQSHFDPDPRGIAARVLWELRLDLALILFALALAAYLELVLGLAGLGSAAKAASAGARAGAWARGVRGALLSLDDAAQIVRGVSLRRRAREGCVPEPPAADLPSRALARTGPGEGGAPLPLNPWRSRWPRSSRITVAFGGTCALLLVLAPLLTTHDYPSLGALLCAELHPWPSGR